MLVAHFLSPQAGRLLDDVPRSCTIALVVLALRSRPRTGHPQMS